MLRCPSYKLNDAVAHSKHRRVSVLYANLEPYDERRRFRLRRRLWAYSTLQGRRSNNRFVRRVRGVLTYQRCALPTVRARVERSKRVLTGVPLLLYWRMCLRRSGTGKAVIFRKNIRWR